MGAFLDVTNLVCSSGLNNTIQQQLYSQLVSLPWQQTF